MVASIRLALVVPRQIQRTLRNTYDVDVGRQLVNNIRIPPQSYMTILQGFQDKILFKVCYDDAAECGSPESIKYNYVF